VLEFVTEEPKYKGQIGSWMSSLSKGTGNRWESWRAGCKSSCFHHSMSTVFPCWGTNTFSGDFLPCKCGGSWKRFVKWYFWIF